MQLWLAKLCCLADIYIDQAVILPYHNDKASFAFSLLLAYIKIIGACPSGQKEKVF